MTQKPTDSHAQGTRHFCGICGGTSEPCTHQRELAHAQGTTPATREQVFGNLMEGLVEAEHKAWDSLSRYKFQMFGYWAAIWVHLNRISGQKNPSPFRLLVANAKDAIGPHKHQDDCELLASVHTSLQEIDEPSAPSVSETPQKEKQ